MRKTISTRQVKMDDSGREVEFFFPKPIPRTITARTRKEAEAKLQELENNK